MTGYEVFKVLDKHKLLIRHLWTHPLMDCSCVRGDTQPCFGCDVNALHRDLEMLMSEFS